MRYSASEKFEIIELVEQSSLSIRRTLAPIGIPRSNRGVEFRITWRHPAATDALESKKLEFQGWRGPAKAIKRIKKVAL